MSAHILRLELSQSAADFERVALEPGVPMIDESGGSYATLRRWFGNLVAEPVRQATGELHYFIRDEQGARLTQVECVPATLADLTGSYRAQMDGLGERLKTVKPASPMEQALLRAVRSALGDLTKSDDAGRHEGSFVKYREASEPWRLAWCWGYRRKDRRAVVAEICMNPKCKQLYLRGPEEKRKCPGCMSAAALPKDEGKVRRKIKLASTALLVCAAAVLFLAGRGSVGLLPRFGLFGRQQEVVQQTGLDSNGVLSSSEPAAAELIPAAAPTATADNRAPSSADSEALAEKAIPAVAPSGTAALNSSPSAPTAQEASTAGNRPDAAPRGSEPSSNVAAGLVAPNGMAKSNSSTAATPIAKVPEGTPIGGSPKIGAVASGAALPVGKVPTTAATGVVAPPTIASAAGIPALASGMPSLPVGVGGTPLIGGSAVGVPAIGGPVVGSAVIGGPRVTLGGATPLVGTAIHPRSYLNHGLHLRDGRVVVGDLPVGSVLHRSRFVPGSTVMGVNGTSFIGADAAVIGDYFRTHPLVDGDVVEYRSPLGVVEKSVVSGAAAMGDVAVSYDVRVVGIRIQRISPQEVQPAIDLELAKSAEYRLVDTQGKALSAWTKFNPQAAATLLSNPLPRAAGDDYEMFVERRQGGDVRRFQVAFQLIVPNS